MIKVTHLTKRYGDRRAVNDISFELRENKVIGFLGPNGAGKSTTMNMITGYLAPDQGTVLINDINLMKYPEKAKVQIGYLPEIPPLYIDMTVYEYLDFVSGLKGIKKKEKNKEIARVMELARVEGVKDRLIKNLSKGYRQRIGIAEALIGNPEILIFDEPTVGLDPKQIVEIRNLIKTLGKKHTVILSTHILSEVEAVCDEIVIISRGEVVAHDKPENLVQSFNQKQEITIVVGANATRGEKVLKDNTDLYRKINQYEVISEQGQQSKFHILVKEGEDIRKMLMECYQKQNIMVLELAVKEMSLEDVYLKLTSDTYLDSKQIGVADQDEEEEEEE